MPAILTPFIVTTVVSAMRRREREDTERDSQAETRPRSAAEIRADAERWAKEREEAERRIVPPFAWTLLLAVVLTAIVVGATCLILKVQGVPLPPLWIEPVRR